LASPSEVRDAVERYIRHEPIRTSKSRIKRLRDLAQPRFRLRVGETRVFYDVVDQAVQVLAVVSKAQASAWLEEGGTSIANGGIGEDEG
jgi:mRNA-degrading endonuclease RelE of RelBE toxin-antitoxin system